MPSAMRKLVYSNEDTENAHIDYRLLKRMLIYARPYWLKLLVILLCVSLQTFLKTLKPKVVQHIIDDAIQKGAPELLDKLVVVAIILPLLSGIISVFHKYITSKTAIDLTTGMQERMFVHLQAMSLGFFTNTKAEEIVSRLESDVSAAQRAITSTFLDLITDFVLLAFALSYMFSINLYASFLSVAILPLFWFPAKITAKKVRALTKEVIKKTADKRQFQREHLGISGILLMKIFGMQDERKNKFLELSYKVREVYLQSAMVGNWFWMALGMVDSIGLAIVYWYGGYAVLDGQITLGVLISFAAYLKMIYQPLSNLLNAQLDIAKSCASFERIFEVLDLPIDIAEKPNAVKLEKCEGRITFQNVSFNYNPTSVISSDGKEVVIRLNTTQRFWHPSTSDKDYVDANKDKLALDDISFEVQPGQMAALVGPSGAGKTTTAYLLPRLYDVTSGSISIDGVDIRDISLNSLGNTVGMVTQEVYLFNDTILANIKYANPSSTMEEVRAACKTAFILDFIENLPEGFETKVGERGYRLSGGEKQRIGIARVLLKSPKILIMDEPSSQLDGHSEMKIQEALQPLFESKERTCIVIAHRLSTILSADVIIVLDHGKIVEKGTHAELLKLQGLYSKLYHTQYSKT